MKNIIRVYRVNYSVSLLYNMSHTYSNIVFAFSRTNARELFNKHADPISDDRRYFSCVRPAHSIQVIKTQNDYNEYVVSHIKDSNTSKCGRWWKDENEYLVRPLLEFEFSYPDDTIAYGSNYRIASQKETWELR